MSKGHVQGVTKQESDTIVKEAKECTCACAGTTDFGMTSKMQIALVVRNLVLDFHTKKAEFIKLTDALNDANRKITKFGAEIERLNKLIDLQQ